jgi:hypothetical protein
MSTPESPELDRSDFDALISSLGELDEKMESAQLRMRMPPGRKSKERIDFLVRMLVRIPGEISRDYPQRTTKNSSKAQAVRFVFLCAAKVGLSEPQIQRALKRTIATFHDLLINEDYDESIDEYVVDANQKKSRRSRNWRSRNEDFAPFRQTKEKKAKGR